MTWYEFYQLAFENYAKGGDVIVECWDESDFNEYVHEFGKMTKTDALSIFKTNASVYADICGEIFQPVTPTKVIRWSHFLKTYFSDLKY